MLFISLASGQEIAAPVVPVWVWHDKLLHVGVFGLLATAFRRAGSPAWLAIMTTIIFGALDEWHQSLTPYRTMDFADFVADCIGAVMAVPVYDQWTRYRAILEWPIPLRWPKGGRPDASDG